MSEDVNKQAILNAIDNIRQASTCIESAKTDINNSLSGNTFNTYISVLNDINMKIQNIKTRLERLI